MFWDLPHHRGAGFPLHILHPAGAFLILFSLLHEQHLRPTDLIDRLATANAADEPVIGRRELPERISDILGYLRQAGLIRRYAGNRRGAHTRYDLTDLGAGLIGALAPLGAWGIADFDFLADATRARLNLPALERPAPKELRHERLATGMALGLLSGTWSDTVMVYVDSAGPAGIGPLRLERTVNAAIAESSGESRVERRLHRDTLYSTLHRLVAKGLLERREESRWVRYALTSHGRGLMGAWWQVADTWGIAHDEELFRIMARMSAWFPDASPG